MIPQNKLDFWVENRLNVLLISEKGVGKSSIILETFRRHKLKYLYFSAATMDVFTDLIGIPRTCEDERGRRFIEYIKPKSIVYDDVDAIFIDEVGRGSKRILNSIFELLQFKTLNGEKMSKLKLVWAATNPEDRDEETDEFIYDVSRLDPALKDRFHVIYEIPYKPDKAYFSKKFPSYSDAAIDWWNDLEDKQKELVSPRRLDYTLEIYRMGGDVRDVLPKSVNISKLITELSFGSYDKQLKELFEAGNVDAAREFISKESNYSACIEKIKNNKNYIDFFLPLVNDEKFVSALDPKVIKHLSNKRNVFENKVSKILEGGARSKILKELSQVWLLPNKQKFKFNDVRFRIDIISYYVSNFKKDFRHLNQSLTDAMENDFGGFCDAVDSGAFGPVNMENTNGRRTMVESIAFFAQKYDISEENCFKAINILNTIIGRTYSSSESVMEFVTYAYLLLIAQMTARYTDFKKFQELEFTGSRNEIFSKVLGAYVSI